MHLTLAGKSTAHWTGRGVNALMGGWLIWLLLGGLFLFLMFRGGGCCGGHGDHDHPARGSPGRKDDGTGRSAGQ